MREGMPETMSKRRTKRKRVKMEIIRCVRVLEMH